MLLFTDMKLQMDINLTKIQNMNFLSVVELILIWNRICKFLSEGYRRCRASYISREGDEKEGR